MTAQFNWLARKGVEAPRHLNLAQNVTLYHLSAIYRRSSAPMLRASIGAGKIGLGHTYLPCCGEAPLKSRDDTQDITRIVGGGCGGRYLRRDWDLWNSGRAGNRLVMRSEAQAQKEQGEMICVPFRVVLTFGGPEPVMERDN